MSKYNGSSCIAPNCKSGYRSQSTENAEKIHFFSVPGDKDILEKWQKAILRKNFVIRTGQVVCQKHFHAEEILWKREVKDGNGKVIASVSVCCKYYCFKLQLS